jgi:2TM domain
VLLPSVVKLFGAWNWYPPPGSPRAAGRARRGRRDAAWRRAGRPVNACTKGGIVMSEISPESLEEARRYVRRKRIFYTVLGVWIALCVMWFLIDVSDDSSSWWFYWPMLGTGIAVAIAGIVLLGVGGLFGADWERREIDKYLRRRGKP